ncbi:cyclopropane fatty acyl phospholipid synthase [Halodesulfovibrio sp.]|jgi:cyclopropane-fatty-acyl-phospholipid synthase|uniref:cyclopropane fatty acyl phospholipid synthase n=1 Tax=Halodesulfovibrio sp. TaxID=1912772 RepID=UPI0026007C35|nr:cyclopropane fatty acyl phospholipid synthase [Halodesulfovibrio sp.]MCT4627067.1 cyclopropane fatty acyl phospholipid synthase [Halodesulfovibrio sp.]
MELQDVSVAPQAAAPVGVSEKEIIDNLLQGTGVTINGTNDWDPQFYSSEVISRVLAKGNLGLGEAYMDNLWDVPKLDEFFYRVVKCGVENRIKPAKLLWHSARFKLLNLETVKRAKRIGEFHYDLGNTFYQSMLDKYMAYSCGYWKDAATLEQAQEAKLELICRKIGLERGMRVLDIGCGWGSFMRYAAERYGVECVGLTVSAEQVKLGRDMCKGLPVEFRLKDYRKETEVFDRVVSVGMCEHVGRKNYRTYMKKACECLKDDGLFLLHTIGKRLSTSMPDPFISKYIFPVGQVPALEWLTQAAEGLFVLEDLHNFGADYDTTLMAWHERFEEAWPQFKDELGDRFYRMWRYYLLSCAGAFRARDIQLWQMVFSKNGMGGGYCSCR